MMTKMELLNALVEGATVTAEMAEKAKAWGATLAKANSRPTKAQTEVAHRKAAIYEYLKEVTEPKTAAEIAEAVGIDKAKVTGALAHMEGIAVTKGKGKTPNAYAVEAVDEVAE